MTRTFAIAALTLVAATALAAPSMAETTAPQPTAMRDSGNGTYLDLFLTSRSAKWNVSSFKDNTGTTKPSGMDLVVSRGSIGAEFGRRAVNGINWGASFAFERATIRQEVNGANVGNDVDGTGWMAAGTLAYEHDFSGARSLKSWVWGLRGGGTFSIGQEDLKTSNSATPFSGTLEDMSVRPFATVIAGSDNGNLNWEFNGGVYFDIALDRQVKDKTSGNPGGNATMELTPNNVIGLTGGAAVIFSSYRISLQLNMLNELGFRAAFSFLF
jgi:hypothetical protein